MRFLLIDVFRYCFSFCVYLRYCEHATYLTSPSVVYASFSSLHFVLILLDIILSCPYVFQYVKYIQGGVENR